MKKTTKLISILLVAAMLLSMAPLSLTAIAALTPTAIGGCDGNHSGYTEINSKKTITKAGNYYLTGNVSVTDYSYPLKIQCSGTVTLCLNGYDLYHDGNGNCVVEIIATGGDLTVNLCDCKGTGEIYHNKRKAGIYLFGDDSNGYYTTLNMYGGTIRDCSSGVDESYNTRFNMYGGTIKNCSKYGVFQSRYDGKVNIYGGTITGNTEGICVCTADAVTLTGSPIISGNTNGDLYFRNNNSPIIAKNLSVNEKITIAQYTAADCVVVKVDSEEAYDCFEALDPNARVISHNDNTIWFHGDHPWKDASCTEPKTCQSCGMTEGDPLGHDWSNLDGICANGCGYECLHENLIGEICEICGKSLHTHSFTYTASGDTITAVCTTEGCDLENGDGGYITISAPADLYADGTTAKEAVVDNQLADTSVTYEIVYTDANDATSTEAPKAAGTYTASVTIGGATATVQFEIIKRSSTAENFIYTAPENLVYDGTPKYATVEVSPEITGMGEITVSYYQNGEAVEPINAGTYTVKVSAAESDKYYAINRVELGTLTINTKDISDAFIILGDALTYNGTEQTQTVEKVIATGTAPEVTFTVSGNTATNVGVYLLTVTGTGNFSGEAKIAYEIAVDASGIEGVTPLNVKSSDKAQVEFVLNQLENAVTELADADKRAEWDNLKSDCVELLAVISDTADEINRINDAVAAYDINTVTGNDVPALVQLADDTDLLLGTDNLTAEEREALVQTGKDIQRLISRYDRISAQIGDIKERMNGYDEVAVKSSDKADIEQLKADIKDLTDGQNLTAAEREYLVNADATCDKLLAKIAQTKSEYDRVIALANGYDKATVTSEDRADVDELRMDAHYLAVTDNVTDEEKENLLNVFEKLTEIVETLINVGNEIERIISAVGGYDEATVKYSDYKDILQLIDDIEALTDGQNITEDERASLEELNTKANLLAAKIRSTADEIARITRAVNAYNIDTVKSSDKTDIENLIARIKKLTDGDNITADERSQLEGNEETLSALLEKINATADEIARIENAVNSYDEETVKSTDKADLEQLVEDIKALTDATNLTEDERAKLGELDAKVDALIKKIDDTAEEIARIDEAVNGYDEESVKSSDEEAIEQLKEDIQALTDGDNITEEERAALEGNKTDADALTDKIDEIQAEIERINDAVDAYDIDSVKSPDREAIDQLKEDIEALKSTDNVTEEEIAALEEKLEQADALTERIDEIEAQLERIAGVENYYNPETVTSDDKAAIEDAIAEIEAVNADNLTDEQKAEYEEIKAGFEALLEEVAAAENAVADIGEDLELFDEERITIFWEDDIEALKAEIDELLADENMGEAENAKLNDYKAQCDNLIEIINTPAKYFSMRLLWFVWDALHWLSSHAVFVINWIARLFI